MSNVHNLIIAASERNQKSLVSHFLYKPRTLYLALLDSSEIGNISWKNDKLKVCLFPFVLHCRIIFKITWALLFVSFCVLEVDTTYDATLWLQACEISIIAMSNIVMLIVTQGLAFLLSHLSFMITCKTKMGGNSFIFTTKVVLTSIRLFSSIPEDKLPNQTCPPAQNSFPFLPLCRVLVLRKHA